MTQLLIAGVEAVLPQNFTCTVKRENPFFTKSGEYTYDITLRLDNAVNRRLYGFLHRMNNAEPVVTGRSAILVAGGHVYLHGTEIVTGWTQDAVSVQLVSGESELNWLIGQDIKVSDLQLPQCDTGFVTTLNNMSDERDVNYPVDLGWPKFNCCFPMVRDSAGVTYNQTLQHVQQVFDGLDGDRNQRLPTVRLLAGYAELRPQPFLCALVRGIIEALDYEIGTDELALQETFKRAFLVNTVNAQSLDETLPGWTVKEFLTEVEKLTGCCMLVGRAEDPHKRGRVDILLKTTYYKGARQHTLRNVIDAYEVEVQDESDDAEVTTSNIAWDLPNTQEARLACLPESVERAVRTVRYRDLSEVRRALTDGDRRLIGIDEESGRWWIMDRHTFAGQGYSLEKSGLRMVNYLRPLEREGATDTVELNIKPALMDWWMYNNSFSAAGFAPKFVKCIVVGAGGGESATDEDGEAERSFGDAIRETEDPSDPQKCDLYVALFNGLHLQEDTGALLPVAYVDARQATEEPGFGVSSALPATMGFEGSLLLSSLDENVYSANRAYQIDTRHRVTVETYDPNRIDVRMIYVVNNRRYVVRDVEETITAEGRQPRWKATLYPITISDVAADNLWVLTDGVWDDGGAWLDDGRWNDGGNS